MKKLSLLLFVGVFAFVGCTEKTTDPKGGDGESAAPTSYTQKAILEYFSGAWCGYCPDGRLREQAIRSSVSANAFMAVVYHAGNPSTAPDNMDIVYDDQIVNTFQQGYPTGMINRINGVAGSRGGWTALVNAVLSESAKCGLAINSSTSGDNLSVTIKLGVGSADLESGNYFLTVLLTEKEMTGVGVGWDQRNYYSQFGAAAGGAGHFFYNSPDPIPGYVHTNTVRAVLQNQQLGDKIDAAALAAGALTEFNFTWDIQGLDTDLQIVAFISEFTDNISTSGIESSFVYNAQIADVGQDKAFD